MLRELGATYFSLVLQDYNRELHSIGRTLRDLLANLDGVILDKTVTIHCKL